MGGPPPNRYPDALMVKLAVSNAILMKHFVKVSFRSRFQHLSSRELELVLILGAAAILSSSCALHKPPAHAKVVGQALPKATPLPPNWTSNSARGAVTNDWVKSFHDSGLERIIAEAIANNLDLRQSAARVEEARQNVIVIGAQLKPQISAVASGADLQSKNSLSQQGQNFRSNMEYGTVSWELDVWGRLRAQRAAAQANYQAVAFDYALPASRWPQQRPRAGIWRSKPANYSILHSKALISTKNSSNW